MLGRRDQEDKMEWLPGTIPDRSEAVGAELAMQGEVRTYPHLESDIYCPECGQPLRLSAQMGEDRLTKRSWLPWHCLIVGAYIIVAFSLSPWSAGRADLCGGSATSIVHDTFGSVLHETCAEVQWDHVLPRATIGATVVVVGLGSLLRRRIVNGPGPTAAGPIGSSTRTSGNWSSSLLGVWGLTEHAVATFVLVSLIMWGYLIAGQLLAGLPLTLGLLAQASNLSVDVWFEAAQFLRDPRFTEVSGRTG
jgi:hypothetical protein